jgi:siroheme decarboxylase
MEISMLTDREKKIAAYIQKDIPLTKEPFGQAAGQLGIPEQEIISVSENLMKRGFIRKFGAILRHQKAGYTRNMMVIWAVPEDMCDDIGAALAEFPQVTHCYKRVPAFEGKYNIFTMVHLKSEKDRIIDQLSQSIGIKDYQALSSDEEYKKSSMEYF